MWSRSARIASAAKPSPEPNDSRKCLGKCSDGTTNAPRLDEGGDHLVVHLVAVVDDVDAELERHHDRPLVDQVAADQPAALVRGVDGRGQLGFGHLHLVLRRGRAVTAGDEQLDHVGAALDLLAHAEAERVRAVAQPDRARRRSCPSATARRRCCDRWSTARGTTARSVVRGSGRRRSPASRRARPRSSHPRRRRRCSPARSAVRRFRAAIIARYDGGYSLPYGVFGCEPSSW